MKKFKVLSILSILLAMGLAACTSSGTPTSEGSEPAPSSVSSSSKSSSSAHKHCYVEDATQRKEPTCDQPGEKVEKCECGDTKKSAIPALGHQWGTAVDVAASENGIAYKKYECERNNKADKAVKYDLDVTAEGNITLVDDGKLKADSNLPTFVKLDKPNGGGFELKFDSALAGTGKIYLNGAMDHWGDSTANENRGFFNGNSTSDTHADEVGNFALLVNGTAVDFQDKKSLTFGDMFPAVDADHPAAASGYSPIAEVEVGAVTIAAGLNTIKFTRVDSFNIILKSFVIVFVPQTVA